MRITRMDSKKTRQVQTISWVLFLIAIRLTAGADNGETCETDPDCTVTNQECVKNNFTSNSCNKSQCACADGYAWDSPKCKIKKYDRNNCVDADDKCVTGTCSSGTCSCASGTTYNANLKDCLTDGKKLLDETCSSCTECYGVTGTVTCDTTCQCETGYIKEDYTCRAPHVDEYCVATNANPAGVACASVPKGDTSIATETCSTSTNKCTCPSGSSQNSITYLGTNYKFCLNDYSGTLKPDGVKCTAHNSCESLNCATCPGNNAKTCLRVLSTISDASRLSYSACLVAFSWMMLLKLM